LSKAAKKIVLTKAIRKYQQFLDEKGARMEAYQAKFLKAHENGAPRTLVETTKELGAAQGTSMTNSCPYCNRSVSRMSDIVAIKTRRRGTQHTDKKWSVICAQHFLDIPGLRD
jgi:uncharacterized protein with PIN domain